MRPFTVGFHGVVLVPLHSFYFLSHLEKIAHKEHISRNLVIDVTVLGSYAVDLIMYLISLRNVISIEPP
jgi:hypothetical protein